MGTRPELTPQLDGRTFQSYYYLREELVAFCRGQGLPVSGGKQALTARIAHYLDTGERLPAQPVRRKAAPAGPITLGTPIEQDIVCSELHRAFFKAQIGPSFSFHVPFQRWLKENAGKTYAQAVEAYNRLAQEKKAGGTAIDKQFEYNTYIRDFFAAHPDRPLAQAIRCWNYKKRLQGHHRYEPSDLAALQDPAET